MENSVNKLLESSFRKNWDYPALSNYQGVTLFYRDVARKIEKVHIMYELCGLQKGDKVSICSKNQAHWGVAFLSAISYGAVAVPILHEFKPGNIHHIVNHSESRILFVEESIWEQLNGSEMPGLDAIINLADFSIYHAGNQNILDAREHLNELFGKKYPKNFRPGHVNYHLDKPDELSMINYTSGTTGFSKGVMIPYRSLYSNILFGMEVFPQLNNSCNVVSMLPVAHMYGMMFEFLFEMCVGVHVHFLTRIPSPKIIMDAFAEIKPDIIISVPLIIEKIYKKKLQPLIKKTPVRVMLRLPIIEKQIEKKIKKELVNTFGGKFLEIVIGGAAFNHEAEAFFKRIDFPFTVGYGMTECAPIITYSPWNTARLYSCGTVAPRMQVRIDSENPQNIPGEILVKGDNVMLGYFKNPEATKSIFTPDGWMKTGDMGVMDSDGYLYIRGRSKSMILGPNGQNIYPEEIESILNNLPFVVESLVIEDKGSLIALVYPDFELAESEGLNEEALKVKMEENRIEANTDLPNYSKISSIEIFPEEFDKTPKRSIKRFLYQR